MRTATLETRTVTRKITLWSTLKSSLHTLESYVYITTLGDYLYRTLSEDTTLHRKRSEANPKSIVNLL